MFAAQVDDTFAQGHFPRRSGARGSGLGMFNSQ
jgi:hypothetical protein